jgi:cell division protein FtsW
MRKTKIDYIFILSVLVLMAMGLLIVFSASPTMGLKLGDTYYFIKKHILYLLLGFAALLYGASLEIDKLRQRARLIFGISILLLLLVYIPGVGKKVSGASRWIDLMIFSFQPSELIKFAIIVFLADYLSKLGKQIEDVWKGLLPPLLVVGAVAGLIILQPDLGTAITISATSFILIFAAGARYLHLAFLGGAGAFGVLIISLVSPYRLRRLVAFIDPWKDPQGIGFQVIQSLLAVGSGGLTGLGLGSSRQKFFYLPQQFTDFIFAILCEELGLIGGGVVVILFMLFCARGLRIAYSTGDKFSSLLAVGIVSWLTMQALINIMVVVGMLPTTGIPLPFISYGGTATIINLFAVGIVLNISMQAKQ